MSRLIHYRIKILAVAGLAVFSIVVLAFLANLERSNPGEIVGALGNIIGGTIGAHGSAAAVYFMLKVQRDEETEKTSAAILREITELCKGPLGQLTACALIQSGQIRPPKSELRRLFNAPIPTIYPAVADRISRLPRPTLVVTFYMLL
jgi:hypothetical protein